MIKAFFVDFYGTVVHEDDEIIREITDLIFRTGNADCRSDIGAFWHSEFQRMVLDSYGERFETQRALEERSIENTLRRFSSDASSKELSEMLFAQWVMPPIFEDSKAFFVNSPLPVYIVSNIDTADIAAAVSFHELRPAGVFTSEDARAYKPRQELFELALDSTGLSAGKVIHIGDSLSSDVRGASASGIRALWLNRSGKAVPDGVESISVLPEAFGKIQA